VRALRASEDRGAVAALAAAALAWLVQSLFDMPWEYAAVTVPLFLVLGVVASSPGEQRRGALAAAAAPVLVAAALVVSLGAPWLAQRREEAALDELTRGEPAAAAGSARAAHELNPLSIRPLHLEALALELQGRLDAAEDRYEEAARLQPRNAQAWYELGRFEYEVRRDPEEALVYLDRAWGLDRQSPDTGPLLDRVRADLAERG
jgi:Tfp pilus assembly protein PilF